MDIDFDPDKNESNKRKHKVSFPDVESALYDPYGLTVESIDDSGELRQNTMGTDALGRVVIVTHTMREGRVRIISARKASKGEARPYHDQF